MWGDMPKKYDIVVAGGGPSGLSAAIKAASMGCNVLVLEMQSQIGGLGQPAWVDDRIGSTVPSSVLASVRKVGFRTPSVSLDVRGNFGVVLDRRDFDRGLAIKAADAGVEIWLSAPVRDFVMEGGRVAGVKIGVGGWSEEVRADVVIDATGARGEWSGLFLKKISGKEWAREELAFSSEYLLANFEQKKVSLLFNSYLTPSGHAWVYPCGSGVSSAGVQGIRINPELALDELIGRNAIDGIKKSVTVASFRSQCPIVGPLDSACSDGVVAVGSAAGHVYQFSMRGLRHAIGAGEIAGEVAAESINSGDFSKDRLSEFDTLLKDRFSHDFFLGSVLREALGSFSDRKMSLILSEVEGDRRLGRAVVDLFLCRNLKKSVEIIMENKALSEIFGRRLLEGQHS